MRWIRHVLWHCTNHGLVMTWWFMTHRSAPKEWPALVNPQFAPPLCPGLELAICPSGVLPFTQVSASTCPPHASKPGLTNSYGDQNYSPPHYWLCPSILVFCRNQKIWAWLAGLDYRSLICSVRYVTCGPTWQAPHCAVSSGHAEQVPRPPSSPMYRTNETVIIHRRTKADHFLPELNISLQSSMSCQVQNNPDDSVYCYTG